jgi:hypothetical protein
MADETAEPAEETSAAAATSALAAASADSATKRIVLVSYPKIVFMYPTLIASVIAGLYMFFSGATQAEPASAHIVARVFILIMAINLVVISFDFPRTTSLTLFFLGVAVVAILWSFADVLPFIGGIVDRIQPIANATFYFFIAMMLTGLFIGVFIAVRFDYWEVRPNELLHHHGFLSDLERFSAPNLRIDKEINDIFEYLLLRSGRLVLHPSNERRAIVLENVFFINKKEKDITRMLGALQVQVRNTT